MTNFLNKMRELLKPKWARTVLALVLILVVYLLFIRSGNVSHQFITVTHGTIIETVSVTGNTVPAKNVSLGFQNSGTIARVNYGLGNQVFAGAVIVQLNTGNLSAALEQARASLAVAEANLAATITGTRPEQLAIDRSAVAQDQAALANAITSAYAAADSAIHVTADQIFINPRSASVTLTPIVSDTVLANMVIDERIALEPVLVAWGAQVSSPSFSSSDPLVMAEQAVQALSQISTFLSDVASVLTKAQPSTSVSTATLSTYSSNIATARTSVATAIISLTTAKTTLVSAEGTLTLAEAGSTKESIAAGQAQVDQARAGVANATANLIGAMIVAPINGIVTQLDAKVGQLASPGTPLVSIIGTGGFEVDAGVSETDVGKLLVGNVVTMTFDAFPNETFTGLVFYIAPAQTNTQGVISYQIKISFDKADLRMKSGLTANIDIQTKKKDNALILPQYAVLQNDKGTFVETLVGKVSSTSPVTLGIQDQQGNVEVLFGVTLGEQVINIGLKKK